MGMGVRHPVAAKVQIDMGLTRPPLAQGEASPGHDIDKRG